MLPSMKSTDPIPIRKKRLDGSLYDEERSRDAYDRASVRVNKFDSAQHVITPPRVSSLLPGSLHREQRHSRTASNAFDVEDEINELGLGQELQSDVISNRALAGKLLALSAASPLSSEASSESDSSFARKHSYLSMRHASHEDFSQRRLTSKRSLIWENHSRTLPRMDHEKRPSLHSILTQFSPSDHTSSRPSTVSSIVDNEALLYPAPVLESSSLGSSASSGRESPSSYLIDDDPFANLGSPSREYSLFRSPSASTEQSSNSSPASPILGQISSPSSPLKPSQQSMQASTSNAFVHVTPGRHRSSSSISQHAQSGKIRPIFVSRPSLPSLSTLARMNVNLPSKKRKGRVSSTASAETWSGCDSGSPSSLVSVAENGHSNNISRSMDSRNGLSFNQDSSAEDTKLNRLVECRAPSAIFTGLPVTTIVTSELDEAATVQSYIGITEPSAKSDCIQVDIKEDTSVLPRLSVHDEYDFFLPIEPAYTHTELAYSPHQPTTTGHSTSSQVSFAKKVERRFGRYMLETSSLYKSKTSHQSSSTFSSLSETISPCMELDHEVPVEVDDSTGWRPDNARMSGFEPGSSAGTVRPLSRRNRRSNSSQRPKKCADGVVDENVIDYDILRTSVSDLVVSHSGGNNSSVNHYGSGRQQSGNNGQSSRNAGSDNEYQDSSRNPFRGKKDSDDDDDDDIYRSARSAFSTSTSSEDGSSAESDNEVIEITDQTQEVLNLSIPVDRRRNGRKGVYVPPPVQRTESTEDDDIPLAQRIPSALKAQKSIRKQVKNEQVQRKREKMKSMPSSPTRDTTRTKSRSVERGRHVSAMQHESSNLRRAEIPRTPNPENRVESSHVRRVRAKTIDEGGSGVAADDLAKRLLDIQFGPNSRIIQSTRSEQDRSNTVLSPLSPNYKSTVSPKYPANYNHPVLNESAFDQGNSVRSARSFHNSSKADSSAIADSIQQTGEISLPKNLLPGVRQEGFVGHQTSLKATNIMQSEEKLADSPLEHSRKLVKSNRQAHETNRSTKSPISPPDTRLQHSAALASSFPTSPLVATATVTQIRIFIDNLQKFRVIEIGEDTNAGAVVEIVTKRGELMDESSGNYYMLWEICQDFGIERPIRDFELLADVSSSWNTDKMVNVFMIKNTSLASTLSVQSMPRSAPRFGGYVQWESKRGKWSKRWLELREHGLWMSKREGKADFLCSLSTFDGYFVTRINKSPKAFVFAVKSTDPITLFENKADYMHVFCCNESDGTQWIQNVLLAKSYVMYQERHVLFTVKNSNTVESTRDTSDVFSRSGTHRGATGYRPSQPLINVTPPVPAVTPAGPFEPGSLLAKRNADPTHM